MDHNGAGWALLQTPDRSAAQLAEAIDHFESALVEDPEHRVALTNLLDALLAAGRADEAVQRAERIAEEGPGSIARSRANNWLGWRHANVTKDLARALHHFEAAGSWGTAHLNRAMALEVSGRPDEALEQYVYALRSSETHDRALAHARRAAIQLQRGWLLHALSSARRAVAREEQEPRGRLDTWRADAALIESALLAKNIAFPSAAEEGAWIALERKADREGWGLEREKGLSAVERAWLAHEDRTLEELPTSGPLGPLEELLRARDFEAALAELAALNAGPTNAIMDAAGLVERYGEQAAVAGQRDTALALLGYALVGYEMYAAGSTSGSEGLARMHDVNRVRRRRAEI